MNPKLDNLTWREQTVKCKAGTNTQVLFPDTMPNQAIIYNYTAYTLYAGITCTPNAERYDSKINGHATGFVGRPNGFKQFVIFNPHSVDIDVKVNSVFDKFELTMYQNDNAINEGSQMVVDEIVAPLPAGENEIGKVGLTEDLETLLETVKTKVNDTYNVLTNNIAIWGGSYFYNLTSLRNLGDMPNIKNLLSSLVSNEYVPAYENENWRFMNNSASEGWLTVADAPYVYIKELHNDSSSTLNLTDLSGNVIYTLLEGESLNNIRLPLTSTTGYKITGTNLMYRCIYRFEKKMS